MPNPAVVQSKQISGSSGSFNSPTSAGSCVAVGIFVDSSSAPSISGVTLGGSADNFASAVSQVGNFAGPDNVLVAWWIDPHCASGQTAIAVSGSNLTTVELYIYEISGVNLTAPVDKTASNTGSNTSSGPWTSNSTATTSQANEIWLGIAGFTTANASVTPPGAPWVNLTTATSAAGSDIVSATGAAVYNGTQSGSFIGWCAAVVTLLPQLSYPVSVPTATITVTANPVVPSGLVAAMATAPGTDAGGNAYAVGFTGPIIAFHPGSSPTTVEAWQNATPPSGWTGTLRYKMLSETSFAVIDFDLTHAGAASPVALMTVAAAYAPAANRFRPINATSASSPTSQSPNVKVATSGAVTAEGWTGNATQIGGTIVYPLD